MPGRIRLHLRDLNEPLVRAWRDEFAGQADVAVSLGDIFSDRPGPISADDPIDVTADAIVSPANSFGFMDGGIDAVFTYVLGPQVQDALREVLAREHGGELPVGEAVIVPTSRPEIPWCISAPTMRIPRDVSDTPNAYLAFRAVVSAVLRHNEGPERPIRSILCPGLGTAVGGMPPARCARQMRIAWQRTVAGPPFIPRTLREAAHDEQELLR